MGSPLGPLLTDTFMAKLESSSSLEDHIKSLALYKRYVDDIICMTDESECLYETLMQFNFAHKNIRFSIRDGIFRRVHVTS